MATAFVGSQVTTPPGSTSSTASAILDVVLGLVLGVVAWRRARRRAGPATQSTPAWMARIDTMSPTVAFGLGAFLPPYVVAVAYGNEVVREALTTGARVLSVVLFVVIGSLGVLVPILVTVVRPRQSDAVLTSWRTWLQTHWPTLLVWLLAGLAVYLIAKGLIELRH